MVVRFVALLICLVVSNLGCQAGESATDTPESAGANAPAAADAIEVGGETSNTTVVARIGSDEITMDAVDEFIKEDLFERQMSSPAAAHSAREAALDSMVKLRVIEEAGAARNMSGEEFVMAEVTAMGDVPDTEVEKFYQDEIDKMGDQTLEQAGPRIKSYLMQLRMQDVVNRLMEEAGAVILLETPRVEVAATGPFKGPADAPVTIIEFSDFQCPYCSRALPVLTEVMAQYPEQVRLVYRHLPLDRIHARARPAAAAAVCAEAQGQFWPYHDLLFANAQALGDEDLAKYAAELKLDVEAWTACLADPATKTRIDTDLAAGNGAGITGTPAFIINGIVLSGARPADEFAAEIEKELARQAKAGAS